MVIIILFSSKDNKIKPAPYSSTFSSCMKQLVCKTSGGPNILLKVGEKVNSFELH